MIEWVSRGGSRGRQKNGTKIFIASREQNSVHVFVFVHLRVRERMKDEESVSKRK